MNMKGRRHFQNCRRISRKSNRAFVDAKMQHFSFYHDNAKMYAIKMTLKDLKRSTIQFNYDIWTYRKGLPNTWNLRLKRKEKKDYFLSHSSSYNHISYYIASHCITLYQRGRYVINGPRITKSDHGQNVRTLIRPPHPPPFCRQIPLSTGL